MASPTPLHHPSPCATSYYGPVVGVFLGEIHPELSTVLQNVVHRKKAKVVALSRPTGLVGGFEWLLVESPLSLLRNGYHGHRDVKDAS